MDDRPVRIWGEVMKRSMVMVTVSALALAAVLVSGAPAFARRGGQGRRHRRRGDEGRDPHRRRRRRRQPVQARPVPGRGRRREGCGQVHQRHRRRRGPEGRRSTSSTRSSTRRRPRNAIITACRPGLRDWSGPPAAFLTNVEDETNCKDQAGKATGLPDLASFVTGVQQCSPVAYPVNPSLLDCATKDQHPADVSRLERRIDLVQRSTSRATPHGVYVASNDSAVGQRAAGPPLRVPEASSA